MHHEENEGHEESRSQPFMSFMPFMVKTVSGLEPKATTRFAPPN